MDRLLEVADEREHGESGLHEHTIVPRSARADLAVGRVVVFAREAGERLIASRRVSQSREARLCCLCDALGRDRLWTW